MLSVSNKHPKAKLDVIGALKRGHMVQYLPVSLLSLGMSLQSMHDSCARSSDVVLINLRERITLQFLAFNVSQQVLDCYCLQTKSIVLQSSLNEPSVILLLLAISEQALEHPELSLNDHSLPEIFGL